MILNKKGEIIQYIKNNKKVRSMEIHNKFGVSGYVNSIITILKHDKVIEQKYFDCGCCKYWVVKK